MARILHRRRRGGIVHIYPAGRWRRISIGFALALFAGLPLALVLAIVLPPVLVAVPSIALGAALWAYRRRRDSAARRDLPPPEANVIRLHHPRAGLRGQAAKRRR